MLRASEVDFFSSIVNSLINRRPFLLEVNGEAMGQPLRQVLSLVPAHRWLLVSGTVPRWVKHLASQPRELPTDDMGELGRALLSTFDEERMGRRPVQFLYFGADAESYDSILKPLSMGWTAVSNQVKPILERLPGEDGYYVRKGEDGITAYHLGSEPNDLSFERRLFGKAIGLRKACVTFLVQKKLSEMHLAGTAILNELEETHGTFTLVDLEELFELDRPTVEKEFELVHAERGLDLRRYVTMPSAEVNTALGSICRVPNVVAAAVLERGKLVSLRRLKQTEVHVPLLAAHLDGLFEKLPEESGMGNCCHIRMTCSAGEQVVAVKNRNRTYVVLFSSESKLARGAAELMELLEAS